MLYTSNKKIENDFSFNFNLEGTFTIENNLFGLVYKGIRIMKYYTGLFFTNTTTKNKIETEKVVLKDEKVSLCFETHEIYEKKNHRIEYANVLEEPNYDVSNEYMENIDESYGNSKENEKDYYRKYEYTGKSSNFSIIISDNLLTDCNDSCSLCFSNYTCVTCKYNYTFNGNIKECLNPFVPTTILTTIPTTISTTTPTTIPSNPTTILNILTTYISNNDIIITTIPLTKVHEEDCTIDEIMEGQCKGRMANYQIKEIYDILKHNISDNSINIIQTENVIFQLSTFEEQKNSDNPNVSSIDLGKCEELIKSQEGLNEEDNLIVLKTDIKSDDLTSTYVQYEIYHPYSLALISLEVCKDIPINVNIPVTLDENAQSVCDSLCESGYNLFDLNDSFYNDICTTYTTENGTDLTLAGRKNLIYDNNGNVSMCQEGCTFQSFNCTTRKAKCDCSVQTRDIITDIKIINFDKEEIVGNFFNTLKNSNFLVLKCYKLVFSAKGQKKNIGSYLMSGITFIFIVLMVLYFIKGNSDLTNFTQIVLKQKFKNCKNANSKSTKSVHSVKNRTKMDNIKKSFKEKNPKGKNIINTMPIKNNKNPKNKNKLKSQRKNKSFPPKRKSANSSNNVTVHKKVKHESLMTVNAKTQDKLKSQSSLIKINAKRFQKKGSQKHNKLKTVNKNTKPMKFNEKYKIKELNDEELNNLEYEIAKVVDKRTFFQYYFSLLKKKQLIFFAFYPANDYNLILVKISLLLLAFSLYFTINGFFFSDETMNKINEEQGSFNILLQIPQILYSTIISAVINMILKRLSLSERQILSLKIENNFLAAEKKAKKIKSCLRIKLFIFFLLSFLLMLFFWYFISCFCAVYKNTQIILIKDTLISFGLSMLYPFGLNLLPGMFRIPALRSEKKDKKCLYTAGSLLALI